MRARLAHLAGAPQEAAGLTAAALSGTIGAASFNSVPLPRSAGQAGHAATLRAFHRGSGRGGGGSVITHAGPWGGAALAARGERAGKIEKDFFFEKKKQKTFTHFARQTVHQGQLGCTHHRQKFSGSFFSKKNYLLSFLFNSLTHQMPAQVN